MLRPADVISSEFVIAGQGRRADLALLGRKFIGVEIKSDRDSLQRLTPQLDAYTKCFDKVLLVVAPRHLEQALFLAPLTTSVWSIDSGDRVLEVRKAAAAAPLSAHDLVRALTLEEARRAFSARSGEDPRHAAGLTVPVGIARAALLDAFAARFGATSAKFWMQVGDRSIVPDDIARLSRFAERRRVHAEANTRRQDFWSDWKWEAQRVFGSSATHTP